MVALKGTSIIIVNCIEFFMFQKFRFKKQVSSRIIIKGFEQIVIGTIWESEFDCCSDQKLIQFALDTGLGERNSLGFGFLNPILAK